jgi:large subunit ribosomal protein L35
MGWACLAADEALNPGVALTISEVEMPKMKTKSSCKKRFRVTGTGKVIMNVAYKRHCLSSKPQQMKRQARGTKILSTGDEKIVRVFMPYL